MPTLPLEGRISPGTVERLLGHLNAIKEDDLLKSIYGELNSENNPESQALSTNYTQFSTAEEIHSLRHSLSEAQSHLADVQRIRQAIERLNAVFQDVRSAIRLVHEREERQVKSMQTRFTNLVFQDGLDRIPDEILACIFESGHDIVNHPFFSLNVSHVCRRFRDVALKTPLLWTRIHGNVNLIPTFLARSGKLDLDISFPYSSSQANDKYFNVVKLHSDRWSHLRLDYPPFSLRSRLGLLGSLPRLRFLQCLNATSTFRLPNMPSLVHFKGDTITLPQSPLVICELTLYLNFDPAQLISALYQLKNLRRLSISFNNISAQSRVEDAPIYQPEFALQSLFLSSTSQTPSKIIPRLCSVLPFHPISKLTVAVSGNCVKDLWMDDDGQTFSYPAPDITIKTLLFNPDFPTESCDILTRVLRGTGAHTISIESSVASFIPRDATAKSANEALWSTYASLRKLRLKNCDELREWQVKALADNLVSSEVGKGLQSLEILSCENISEGFLLNLGDTMGRKLTWVL